MSESEVISIEARGSDLEHKVMATCIGSCGILGFLPEGERMPLLETCANEGARVWCAGSTQGPNGNSICRQPRETKDLMMRRIRETKV